MSARRTELCNKGFGLWPIAVARRRIHMADLAQVNEVGIPVEGQPGDALEASQGIIAAGADDAAKGEPGPRHGQPATSAQGFDRGVPLR